MQSSPGFRILSAIDGLDDLVFHARHVPLTDQLRVRAKRLEEARANVESAGVAEGIDSDEAFAAASSRLSELVRAARPIPLTRDVRFDRDEMFAAITQLRDAIPEWLNKAAWDWHEARGGAPRD